MLHGRGHRHAGRDPDCGGNLEEGRGGICGVDCVWGVELCGGVGAFCVGADQGCGVGVGEGEYFLTLGKDSWGRRGGWGAVMAFLEYR